jgi:rfaE bifunctional protein nucleotidyltransferase chain/domain
MQSKLEQIQSKILGQTELLRKVNQWRLMGRRIVFTNGCFDLLHRGHLTYLLQAAEAGNRLIIGLNDDASVQRLKGPSRPILDQETRSLALASLTFVDAVTLFSDDTPLDLIEAVQPDVLVKGGDYSADTVVGSAEVVARGGQVTIIPFIEGYSTTSIIEKIRA